MGCGCGKPAVAEGVYNPQKPKAGVVVFEYIGERPFTVFGRVTGIRYHFSSSGVRHQVDERDARALELMPQLRRAPA